MSPITDINFSSPILIGLLLL